MDHLQSLDNKDAYTVGWIAALDKELAAAIGLLDEEHGPPLDFRKPSTDPNSYTWGRMGKHNVVIAALASGVYGKVSAATTAVHLLSSFTNVKVGLMVGIGAAIARPDKNRDIRLGDVVVSQPSDKHGGVVQYDLGKNYVTQTPGGDIIHGYKLKGSLNKPPEALLKALTTLKARVRMKGSKMTAHLKTMLENNPPMAEDDGENLAYVYRGEHNDRLFEASYPHQAGHGCEGCDTRSEIPRQKRPKPGQPAVHYGTIASGDRLVKDAKERDTIVLVAGEECLCLEMEAAGLMDSYPCLVIRGICDYADSHKNDEWQEYAAGIAAAYAKEFLSNVESAALEKTPQALEVLKRGQ
jgi:nucleoside phosphorylase